MRKGSAVVVVAAMFVSMAALVPGASAALRSSPLAKQTDGKAGPAAGDLVAPPAQQQLPPTAKNVELVGKLELKGHFGNVDPGQIADVSHKGDYAYLNSWQSQTRSRCDRGGVFVVDIKDPAHPKEVGFIASPTGTYPGEGSQVIAVDTPFFKGDLLTINQEDCVDPGSTPATLLGGITLIDVTNPLAPVKLSEGFGDTTPSAAIPGVKDSAVHLVHSAFSWQAGNKAYTVMSDDQESKDVDIVDITNPRAPQLINEMDLTDPADISGGTVTGTAFGNSVFLHDMVVKSIGGRQIMLVSYWDGGYAQIDVTDPTNVTFINDSDFAASDPVFPAFSPPEGNAHEAEYSFDNKYILAADEDFGPFRARITTSVGGFNFAEPVDTTVKIADLPGGVLRSESVRFIGRACTLTGTPVPDTVAPAPAPVDADPNTRRVAVIERGACTFDEKVQAVQAAGYEAFVIFNNAGRPDGDPLLTNGSIDSVNIPGFPTLPGGYMTRADALAGLFGGSAPAVGASGAALTVGVAYDGWGYGHLIDRTTMTDLDQYAVTEARDPRFSEGAGFGTLSIHEFATDPVTSLGYVAYYNAGFRVVSFGDGKLTEVGRFIDDRGNNFWGVDVASDKQGGRLILASDRDYGLYVFRYTGPGAVKAPGPVAADAPVGYWRFGESSGVTAFDETANHNNGTYLNGPVLGVPGALAGDPNTAVRMDGINDYTRVFNSPSLGVGNTFTSEGWIKRASTAKAVDIMTKGFQVIIMSAANSSQVWVRKAGVSTIAKSTTGVPADSAYHHIVVTKNASGPGTVKIYIDGSPVGVTDVAPAQVTTNSTTPLVFGSPGDSPADFDEFALYARVLTAAQVQAHYVAGHPGP